MEKRRNSSTESPLPLNEYPNCLKEWKAVSVLLILTLSVLKAFLVVRT